MILEIGRASCGMKPSLSFLVGPQTLAWLKMPPTKKMLTRTLVRVGQHEYSRVQKFKSHLKPL